MTNKQALFIVQIAPIIVKYAKQYGYQNCSVTLAQACCESGFGNDWSRKNNNYFGIKYGSWVKRTGMASRITVIKAKTAEEYTVGQLTTIIDGFCKCQDMDDAVHLYYEFLRVNSRYKNLLQCDTPYLFASTIRADGYATSSTYVGTLMSYVNNYHLEEYDAQLEAPSITFESINTSGVVTASWLKVRKGPGTGYEVLTNNSAEECQLPSGIICAFDKKSSNGWLELANTSYWVSANYVRLA